MRPRDERDGPTLQLKRIYAPVEEADGLPVLVDRLWARGMSKAAAHLDAWMKDLGPSDELRQWFGHRAERWTDFQERYQRELSSTLHVHPDVEATDTAFRELDPMKRYIVFVDDAHENSAVLRLVRRLLSDPNLTAGTQIVVALRPHFAARLTEALATASRKVAVICLEPIQGEELDAVIQEAPYRVSDERVRSQVLRLAEGEPLLA